MTEIGVRGAFHSEGRPTILFERHKFHLHTAGKYDVSNPEISNKLPGGYGLFSEQHPKLEKAKTLDKDAALKSASWGAFQIMGENLSRLGSALYMLLWMQCSNQSKRKPVHSLPLSQTTRS